MQTDASSTSLFVIHWFRLDWVELGQHCIFMFVQAAIIHEGTSAMDLNLLALI